MWFKSLHTYLNLRPVLGSITHGLYYILTLYIIFSRPLDSNAGIYPCQYPTSVVGRLEMHVKDEANFICRTNELFQPYCDIFDLLAADRNGFLFLDINLIICF